MTGLPMWQQLLILLAMILVVFWGYRTVKHGPGEWFNKVTFLRTMNVLVVLGFILLVVIGGAAYLLKHT